MSAGQRLLHKVTSRQSISRMRALSLMNMRRDSRFLPTAMGLLALIVLLATTAGPVQGGDVFQCPDGKGGVVLRDVPCSVPAPDKQPPVRLHLLMSHHAPARKPCRHRPSVPLPFSQDVRATVVSLSLCPERQSANAEP